MIHVPTRRLLFFWFRDKPSIYKGTEKSPFGVPVVSQLHPTGYVSSSLLEEQTLLQSWYIVKSEGRQMKPCWKKYREMVMKKYILKVQNLQDATSVLARVPGQEEQRGCWILLIYLFSVLFFAYEPGQILT